jgi:cell division septum initiation protein DivIVA
LGKSSRGEKEYSRLQESLHENKKLKKEISSLRKQLARIDLDRHSYVREIVDEHLAFEEQETSTKDMLKSMKNTWQCRECGEGFLQIHLYTRRDGTFYFRHCNSCTHRTRSKRYTPDVKGIFKPNDSDDK